MQCTVQPGVQIFGKWPIPNMEKVFEACRPENLGQYCFVSARMLPFHIQKTVQRYTYLYMW